MATEKALENYHPRYFEVFDKVITQDVEILYHSAQEARAARSRLYAFRRALERSGSKYPRIALMAPLVQFNLKDTTLVIGIPKGI